MLIAVDIDDTLGDYTSSLAEFHNQEYNTKLTRNDFHSYNFWEVWGGTREESIEKVDNHTKLGHIMNVKPLEYSVECIKILKKKNELILITSRPENTTKKETEYWINKNFPDSFSKIYYSYNKVRMQEGKTKEEICIELNVDFLIEDNIDHALDASEKGIKVLLIDSPWNKSKPLSKNITRVKDWKEILIIIESASSHKNKLLQTG